LRDRRVVADGRRVRRVLEERHEEEHQEAAAGDQQRQLPGRHPADAAVRQAVGHAEEAAHGEPEEDDADPDADIALDGPAEQLGSLRADGLTRRRGQRRLGLAPPTLVVDRPLDQRLGEDPREHERDQPAEQSDARGPQDQAADQGTGPSRFRSAQWHGKPRKCRASWTNSWTTMVLPNTEVAPSSMPMK
jgi:hypothetical protein